MTDCNMDLPKPPRPAATSSTTVFPNMLPEGEREAWSIVVITEQTSAARTSMEAVGGKMRWTGEAGNAFCEIAYWAWAVPTLPLPGTPYAAHMLAAYVNDKLQPGYDKAD